MAQDIPELKEDLGFVGRLGDNPNTDDGLSSQELRETFDKAPKIIQNFINQYVVPALNNYIAGSGYLPLVGGYMTGNINMQGHKLLNVGTPVSTTDGVNKMYADSLIPEVWPVEKGGTGGQTADVARVNLGAAAEKHNHSAEDIRDAIPINKGGTGATDPSKALMNLLAAGRIVLSGNQLVDEIPDLTGVADGTLFLIPIAVLE